MRREWCCPRCQRTQATGGQVVNRPCEFCSRAGGETVWMRLVEPPPPPSGKPVEGASD